MANLTDADKVLRNDVGKSIASKLDDIADAIVQHGGGAKSLGQLSDVDIDTTTLAAGQSIVYNDVTEKFENGEVSTVAALDDLTDVSITSAQKGDSLRNDGNGNWVNEPTTIKMTLAEWNDMSASEQTEWLNSHKKTRLIFSDAPNLNETAKQISYEGSTDTVWDKVESKATNTNASPLFKTKSTGALSKTFNANAYSAFSANDIGLSESGYTIVAVLSADNNNANVVLNGYNLSASGSTTMFLYRNIVTSSQTASFNFTLLFARNDIVKAL